MIIVRVELHSAITGAVTELARMQVANTGTGSDRIGDYDACTYRGRNAETLSRGQVQRRGQVIGFPRQALHVWNLIADALANMGYGRKLVNARAEALEDALAAARCARLPDRDRWGPDAFSAFETGRDQAVTAIEEMRDAR